MIGRFFYLALWLLTLAAPAQITAQSLCPWINESTARGAMHHAVEMAVTLLPLPQNLSVGSRPDAECNFFAREIHSTLMIRVSTMRDHNKEYAAARASCQGDIHQLRGVGNDAVACSMQSNGIVIEQVVSRVRTRLLLLRWSHPPMQSMQWQGTTITAADIVQTLAEQVAGSMY